MNKEIKNKKQIYKQWWFWVLIIVIIIVITPKNNSSTESTLAAASEASSESESSSALDDLMKQKLHADNYEYKETDVYYEINYELTDLPLNETDYVSKALTHCVYCADYIFRNTDATAFRIDMSSNDAVVTSLIISKDKFESYSWNDNAYLEGQYDSISALFDKFYVESMLMSKVDTSKVMFKGKLEK